MGTSRSDMVFFRSIAALVGSVGLILRDVILWQIKFKTLSFDTWHLKVLGLFIEWISLEKSWLPSLWCLLFQNFVYLCKGAVLDVLYLDFASSTTLDDSVSSYPVPYLIWFLGLYHFFVDMPTWVYDPLNLKIQLLASVYRNLLTHQTLCLLPNVPKTGLLAATQWEGSGINWVNTSKSQIY